MSEHCYILAIFDSFGTPLSINTKVLKIEGTFGTFIEAKEHYLDWKNEEHIVPIIKDHDVAICEMKGWNDSGNMNLVITEWITRGAEHNILVKHTDII
jgi:hypothetical protein